MTSDYHRPDHTPDKPPDKPGILGLLKMLINIWLERIQRRHHALKYAAILEGLVVRIVGLVLAFSPVQARSRFNSFEPHPIQVSGTNNDVVFAQVEALFPKSIDSNGQVRAYLADAEAALESELLSLRGETEIALRQYERERERFLNVDETVWATEERELGIITPDSLPAPLASSEADSARRVILEEMRLLRRRIGRRRFGAIAFYALAFLIYALEFAMLTSAMLAIYGQVERINLLTRLGSYGVALGGIIALSYGTKRIRAALDGNTGGKKGRAITLAAALVLLTVASATAYLRNVLFSADNAGYEAALILLGMIALSAISLASADCTRAAGHILQAARSLEDMFDRWESRLIRAEDLVLQVRGKENYQKRVGSAQDKARHLHERAVRVALAEIERIRRLAAHRVLSDPLRKRRTWHIALALADEELAAAKRTSNTSSAPLIIIPSNGTRETTSGRNA